MPKETRKKAVWPTRQEVVGELQLPTELELDNVWHEVLFTGLANFLPYVLEDEDGNESVLGEIAREEMANRIRKEYDAGDPEAIRVVKAHELRILLQLKLAGVESKKARAKGGNEVDLRPSFERIQAQISSDPQWEKCNDEFLQAFFSWAEARGLKSADVPVSQPKFDATISIAFASNFPADGDVQRGIVLRDKADAWKINKDEGHMHYHGKACTVLYRPKELFSEDWWGRRRESTLAALDRRFRGIRNDLTNDIIDVMFHHWRQNKKPNSSPTAVEKTGITLKQICEYRGVEPMQENIRLAYLAMRDVRAIEIRGDGMGNALFEIADVDIQLFEWSDTPPQRDTGFIYSPGFFLAKAVDDEPAYFAPYVQKLWGLDPKYYAKAKRLARYLRGEWRSNTQKYLRPTGQGPTRYRKWRGILEDAGIDFEIDGTKNPKRFIQSVHEALEKLYDIEAIAECGEAIYHPADLTTLNTLPRKGVLDAWLNLRVCIDPPADVCDALGNTNKKRIMRSIRAQKAKTLPKNKSENRPKQRKTQ